MVKDRIENLPVYYPLDERLKSLSERRSGKVKEYHSFSIDKECSNLFSVSKGAISAASRIGGVVALAEIISVHLCRGFVACDMHLPAASVFLLTVDEG